MAKKTVSLSDYDRVVVDAANMILEQPLGSAAIMFAVIAHYAIYDQSKIPTAHKTVDELVAAIRDGCVSDD